MKAGLLHREGDQPAVITRFPCGGIKEFAYFEFGRLHRLVELGPAVMRYSENGQLVASEFWQFDIQIQSGLPTRQP